MADPKSPSAMTRASWSRVWASSARSAATWAALALAALCVSASTTDAPQRVSQNSDARTGTGAASAAIHCRTDAGLTLSDRASAEALGWPMSASMRDRGGNCEGMRFNTAKADESSDGQAQDRPQAQQLGQAAENRTAAIGHNIHCRALMDATKGGLTYEDPPPLHRASARRTANLAGHHGRPRVPT